MQALLPRLNELSKVTQRAVVDGAAVLCLRMLRIALELGDVQNA